MVVQVCNQWSVEMDAHKAEIDRLVEVFRALGDATRLRLLGLIAERPRTGKELGELVNVGLPTVSHHIDKLVRSGLVSVTREGQSRRYALDQRTLTGLSR